MSQRDILDILARMPVPAFAFELNTLQFITANQSFQQLVGYSLTELQQLTAEAIRPVADLQTFRNTLTGDVPKGLLRTRYLRKAGSLLNARTHYWNVQCSTDEGAPTKARVVMIEFWEEALEENS